MANAPDIDRTVTPLGTRGAREPAGRPLRVGVLIDRRSQPAWVCDVLRDLKSSEFATVAVVVVNGADGDASQPLSFFARVRRWVRNRSLVPYALYRRFDSARYAPETDAEAETDLEPVLGGVQSIVAVPRMTKHCDYFDEPTVASLRALDLDVVLRFGFRILRGDILNSARYGVWSFHHGDNTTYRGGPPGFWEVWEGTPTTGAVLQRLSEQLDGGTVLARCFAATQMISVRLNRANSTAQAKQMLLPTLRQLWEQDTETIGLCDSKCQPWDGYANRLYVAPRPSEVVTLAWRIAGRLLKNKLRELFTDEQWLLAVRFNPPAAPDNQTPDGTLHRFIEIVPPSDRFWADPFPVLHEDRYYLFYEELVYANGRGQICVAELDDRGMPRSRRVVLQRDYHLSYPHVFHWDGSWYMVPETFEKRRIELYRARRFPDDWVPVGVVLADIDAVDPTMVEIDRRWWLMFATIVRGTEDASALHLYHASSPLGPWTAHRRNPVKVDVRGARPAGRVFRHGGRWYRPAQDGAPRYGEAIRMFEIVKLSSTDYEESEVARLAPRWRPGLVGTHTINAAGALTAIDARQRRMRWR